MPAIATGARAPPAELTITVPVNALLAVALGLGFALCGRKQVRAGAPLASRDLLAVASFELIVFWPVALYFLLVFPDWSWMYLRESTRVGPPLALAVLLTDTAALAGGYVGGIALLRKRQERWLHYALGGVGFVLFLLVVLARKALFHAGTYAEYHAGIAPPLSESKLPWVQAIALVGLAAAGGAVGWTLWSQGRKTAILDTETIQIPRAEDLPDA